MALAAGAGIRDAGNAVSARESLANNLALLDARAKLRQQLEVLVSGLVKDFAQQYGEGPSNSLIEKSGETRNAIFDGFLKNTRAICKNTYAKKDGRYQVYVCVEMGEQQMSDMYKKLSADKMIQIDFQEHQFMKELEKAKEDYRQKKLNE